MPKNKIEDLRNLLFETMERLMDPEDPMDVKTAGAVGDVAQVIVNSAKVEFDVLKLTGRGGSEFIQGIAPVKTIDQPSKPLQIAPTLNSPVTEFTPEEQLCQKCELPDCDDSSPRCLVKIQRSHFKEAA